MPVIEYMLVVSTVIFSGLFMIAKFIDFRVIDWQLIGSYVSWTILGCAAIKALLWYRRRLIKQAYGEYVSSNNGLRRFGPEFITTDITVDLSNSLNDEACTGRCDSCNGRTSGECPYFIMALEPNGPVSRIDQTIDDRLSRIKV